ncbi:hypothetical protein C4K40_2073 [Pseudomonas sp. CMR5c]|nr:hypothetical protein C4K40_2073 [Pseudomonas sp. CMR5c]
MTRGITLERFSFRPMRQQRLRLLIDHRAISGLGACAHVH